MIYLGIPCPTCGSDLSSCYCPTEPWEKAVGIMLVGLVVGVLDVTRQYGEGAISYNEDLQRLGAQVARIIRSGP